MTGFTHSKKRQKERSYLQRGVALLLCGAMVLSMGNMALLGAAEENAATVYETGLCEHHTVHTDACGYVEGGEGSPCTHEHDESCYTLNCTHEHSEECYPADTGDQTEPAEDGAEPERTPDACTHEHEDACYALACAHEHDADCGYAEGVGPAPCRYVCEVCAATVIAWTWVDENGVLQPAKNFDMSDTAWVLAAPKLTADELPALLPTQINAMMKNGTAQTLTVTWNLENPQATALTAQADPAQAGYVRYTATVPEGYILATAIPAVLVKLTQDETQPTEEPDNDESGDGTTLTKPSDEWVGTYADCDTLMESQLPRTATHFIVRHWHTNDSFKNTGNQLINVDTSGVYNFALVEGYIVYTGQEGANAFNIYIVLRDPNGEENEDRQLKKVSSIKDQGEKEYLERYIESWDKRNGTVTLTEHSLQDKNEKELESFISFAVSAGRKATPKYEPTNGELVVQYVEGVHLVKAHVFYKSVGYDESDRKVGSTDFNTENREVDTKLDENTKVYNTNAGLHTDKTASVVDEVVGTKDEGRVFDLDLEAWYSGDIADVGMVLDASGSMAFAADTPEAINIKDLGFADEDFTNEDGETKVGYLNSRNDLIGYYTFDAGDDSLKNKAVEEGKAVGVAPQFEKPGPFNFYTKDVRETDIQKSYLVLKDPDRPKSDVPSIKLDATPSGSFTVAFSIQKDNRKLGAENTNEVYDKFKSQDNKEDNPAGDASLLYIGSEKGSETGGSYFQAVRLGGSSLNRLAASVGGKRIANYNNVFSARSKVMVAFVFEQQQDGRYTVYTYTYDRGGSVVSGSSNDITKTENVTLTGDVNDKGETIYTIVFDPFDTDYDSWPLFIDNVYVYNVALSESLVADLAKREGSNSEPRKIGEIDWEKDVFLTPEQVELLLDPNKTDNSELAVSGYSYFVYDPRDTASEYTPIGYWDGTEPDKEEKELIGYYQFNNGSSNHPDDSTGRDWLLNSVTKAYAKKLEAQVNYADDNFEFKDSGVDTSTGWPSAHSDLHMLGDSKTPNGFHTSGTNNEGANSTNGILLDAHPSSGNFTLSFTVKMGASGDKSTSSERQLAELLYVGPLSGQWSNGGYYRLIRDQQGSYRRLRANANTDRTSWLTDIDAVFNYNTNHVVTLVFENGTVTSYLDGSLGSAGSSSTFSNKSQPFAFADEKDINIIFNGISDQYNGADICIDNIVVYDDVLTAEEVKTMAAAVSSGKYPEIESSSGNTTTVAAAEITRYEDGELKVTKVKLGELTGNPPVSEREGWYYVTHNKDWSKYNGYETGKRLVAMKSGNVVTDKGTIIVTYTDTFESNRPDDQVDEEGNLKLPYSGTGASWVPQKDSTIKFYIDQDGYLRCFFYTGSGDNAYLSYVYELDDQQYVKKEVLQRAIGAFVTDLDAASPDSRVSATRFSTEDVLKADLDNDGKPDLDKLVMLDWTDDPKESTAFLSLTRGDEETGTYGTVKGSSLSEDGLEQYNYGLTGSTSTVSGLKAFKEYLDKNARNDDNIKKYLIVFTDGKDTDITFDIKNGGDDPDDSYEVKVQKALLANINSSNNEAIKVANELRGEKYGYTIFTVMLNGGPVKMGASQYADAHAFLQLISGSEPVNGNDDVANGFEDRERYFFSTEQEEAGGSSDADALTQIFSKEILSRIATPLTEYNVKDYIDPRFDLVVKGVIEDEASEDEDAEDEPIDGVNLDDENGENDETETDVTDEIVLHLDAGGLVKWVDENGEEQTKKLTEDVGLTIELIAKSVNGAGTPTLYYDSTNDMYYLQWTEQTIPICKTGAESLFVWHAQIRVKAKEDFIGANAVLTNGHDEKMNYVFHPEDKKACSGTDRMYETKRGELIEFPSKGFPRTTVNVKVLELGMEPKEKIIYLGEDVKPIDLLEELGGTIDSELYWEYLYRIAKKEAALTEVGELTETQAAQVEAKRAEYIETLLKDGSLYKPYYYLENVVKDSASEGTESTGQSKMVTTNQAGKGSTHQSDELGELFYTWKLVDAETGEEIKDTTEGSNVIGDPGPFMNGQFTTRDTRTLKYVLSVTYYPYPDPDDDYEKYRDLYPEESETDTPVDDENTGDNDEGNPEEDPQDPPETKSQPSKDYLEWWDKDGTEDKSERRDDENDDLIEEKAYGPKSEENSENPFPKDAVDKPQFEKYAEAPYLVKIVRGELAFRLVVSTSEAAYMLRESGGNQEKLSYKVYLNREYPDGTDDPTWNPTTKDFELAIELTREDFASLREATPNADGERIIYHDEDKKYPRAVISADGTTLYVYSDPTLFDPTYDEFPDDDGYARLLPIGTYTMTEETADRTTMESAGWIVSELDYVERADYTEGTHHFTYDEDAKNSRDSVYYPAIYKVDEDGNPTDELTDPNYFAHQGNEIEKEGGTKTEAVTFYLGTYKNTHDPKDNEDGRSYLADRVGMAEIRVKLPIEIPSAGGSGVMIFWLPGIGLLACAAGWLWRKRKGADTQ